MDEELEQFKRKIDITELARKYGYEIDEKASCRTSLTMKSAGSKIIAATAEDGHGIFFDVQGSASGSVIDLVMWQEGVNLGYARKILREFTNQHSFSFPTARTGYTKPEPMSHDRAGVVAAWYNMKPYKPGYLEGRAINPRTVSKFASSIRTDQRGNVCFLHQDKKGISGYEVKNKGFTGFAGGGRKALFMCNVSEHPDEPPAALIVTEAAIDAMSYYQLNPANGLYVSFAGGLSPEQKSQLSELLTSNPQAAVIIATDNDKEGEAYADFIRSIRQDAQRAAPTIGKDWNDTLNTRQARTR